MTLQDNANLIMQASRQRRISSSNSVPSPINPGNKFQLWADDSKDYMKEKKRSAKRWAHFVKKNQGAIIVVVVILLVCIMYLSREVEEDTVQLGDPAVAQNPLAEFERKRLAAVQRCLDDRALKVQASDMDCTSVCNSARSVRPRPLVHQSCVSGCSSGHSIAFDRGCTAPSTGTAMPSPNKVCSLNLSDECRVLCKDYQSQYPKPTIFNQCVTGCTESLAPGCKSGLKRLIDTRRAEGI